MADDRLDPPWSLGGEIIVAIVSSRRRRRAPVMPAELRRLPGPAVVVAERWTSSPVGRYAGFSVGEPARLGLRPGLWFSTMAVDGTERRVSGRMHWGLPGEQATVVWEPSGDAGVRVRWSERDISMSTAGGRMPIPFAVPLRALQRRADGPVVVPFRVWGRGTIGTAVIDVPAGDDLAWAAGSHRAVHVSGLHLLVRPARAPSGRWSSLAAPRRAIEPGMPCQGGSVAPSRALGSVG